MMSMNMTFTAHANPPKNDHSLQSPQSNSLIRISNSSDLGYIRERLSKGENFEDKTIILENNIYITKYEKNGDPVKFKGIFDGNGKTLHFNATNSCIFRITDKGSIIKNLNITGKFEGNLNDGIMAMLNHRTIDNV